MKKSKISRISLLAGIALLLLTAVLTAFAFKHAAHHRLTPLPLAAIEPAEPISLAADNEYYRIPDNVKYQGQQTVSKAGLLTLSTELGHNHYMVNDTAHNTGFLYAEIKADNYTPVDKQRLPLNIALVIDHSGSMAGDKLANVKKAAKFLVNQLEPRDVLSIVAYESSVGVLQKSAAVTDKKSLNDIIDNIVTAGGTNLGGGMMEGFNQVKASYKSGYVNRVLLLSDGLANEGISDLPTLQSIAKKYFNNDGISISTFGVGNDYNENLMTTLAENAGGNYYYIKQPDEIAGIFQKEVNGLLAVVAQQAKLSFTLPAGISVLRVYGGNYEMDKNVMTVNLKDIFASETKGVLIKFRIKPEANTDLPFHTRLIFEDATDSNKPRAIDNLNIMKPTRDLTAFLANFSERVMQQCTMFESNDMLEQAMKEVDNRDYDKARNYGERTKFYMSANSSKFTPTDETRKQDSAIDGYNGSLNTIHTLSEVQLKTVQKGMKSENYLMRTKKEK